MSFNLIVRRRSGEKLFQTDIPTDLDLESCYDSDEFSVSVGGTIELSGDELDNFLQALQREIAMLTDSGKSLTAEFRRSDGRTFGPARGLTGIVVDGVFSAINCGVIPGCCQITQHRDGIKHLKHSLFGPQQLNVDNGLVIISGKPSSVFTRQLAESIELHRTTIRNDTGPFTLTVG